MLGLKDKFHDECGVYGIYSKKDNLEVIEACKARVKALTDQVTMYQDKSYM